MGQIGQGGVDARFDLLQFSLIGPVHLLRQVALSQGTERLLRLRHAGFQVFLRLPLGRDVRGELHHLERPAHLIRHWAVGSLNPDFPPPFGQPFIHT